MTVASKAARFELFKESLSAKRDEIMRKLAESNPGAFSLPPPASADGKFVRKLAIPHREYPSHNFVGWLMGTAGKSKQELERRTKANILVR